MKKWLYFFLFTYLPALAFAAADLPSSSMPDQPLPGGGLTFAPPPTDYSVIFLSNIFGMVDGVLYGTGSQIMGNMFGVFNAAVLTLGGIIIMYTLMVSTMNTAHEGQFLGQKWSSIWIPVRSTIGLALLIPKASGYCLMQIFVMWVVVQGIGAADKIWATALAYLNSGGVIIRSQYQPTEDLISGKVNPLYKGAYGILAGQVCMLGLQEQLNTTRKKYQSQPKEISLCKNEKMAKFCKSSVPDFVSTVDFMNAEKGGSPFTVKMPNFPSGSDYYFLNGICGKITWNQYTGLKKEAIDFMTTEEQNTLSKSRAAALMTLYNNLLPIANVIVKNNPALGAPPKNNQIAPIYFSDTAIKGFGIPFSDKGGPCKDSNDACTNWGSAGGTGVAASWILSGVQFMNAVQSYNAIMAPTLNLQKQVNEKTDIKTARAFIKEANAQGWLMAGSYFFDLVKLNGNSENPNLQDTNTGLEKTDTFLRKTFLGPFGSGDPEKKSCVGDMAALCDWLDGNETLLTPVATMIDAGDAASVPDWTMKDVPVVTGKKSASVNAFVQNSMMVKLPGQPGLSPASFITLPAFKIQTDLATMPEVTEFDCGYVFLLGCFGRAIGDFFYNGLLRPIHSFFMKIFGGVIQSVVNAFIMVPITVYSGIFIQGFKIVSAKGVNPIVALSQMGEHYINASGNMWISMLTMSISTSLLPVVGKFIFALMTMAMPLIIAWLSVMLGVGFVTAYYIPLLPYLIFTFASLGWIIAVIEAMVAAPLVALGVTHPEGHDAFGKGEQAVMIIMNVFLRPAMMIIGYVAAISLSYVGVWILNAGFGHAIEYIVGVPVNPNKGEMNSYFGRLGEWGGSEDYDTINKSFEKTNKAAREGDSELLSHYSRELAERVNKHSEVKDNAYTSWAGIYAFFFAILAYTSAYLTIVQKSFTLIHLLPDKVLRWIGGQPESIGAESAGWAEESKKSIESAGEKTAGGQAKLGEKLGAAGDRAVSAAKGAVSGATDSGGSGVEEK